MRRAAHASVTLFTEKPRMSRSRESSTQSGNPGSLGTRLENPHRRGQGGLQTNLNSNPKNTPMMRSNATESACGCPLSCSSMGSSMSFPLS